MGQIPYHVRVIDAVAPLTEEGIRFEIEAGSRAMDREIVRLGWFFPPDRIKLGWYMVRPDDRRFEFFLTVEILDKE